jgi:thioredoxin-like negative regulator of GroEL
MKKILFLLCFLSIFQLSCASRVVCKKDHVKNTIYSSKESVAAKLSSEESNKVARLLFEAPWCGACKRLEILMGQADVTKGVLRLNIDETWAFIFSKRFGISSVPALVELRKDSPPIIIMGADKIVMHLLIK